MLTDAEKAANKATRDAKKLVEQACSAELGAARPAKKSNNFLHDCCCVAFYLQFFVSFCIFCTILYVFCLYFLSLNNVLLTFEFSMFGWRLC